MTSVTCLGNGVLRSLLSSVTDLIFWIVKLLLQLADSHTNRVETMSS